MIKRNNVDIALKIAREARDLLGANGIVDDYQPDASRGEPRDGADLRGHPRRAHADPRRAHHGDAGDLAPLIEIFVDGDGCPVKDETYAVGARYGLRITVVANSRMFVPADLGALLVVVDRGPDAADDWIAENVRPSDVVVTADIPLAARCLDAGARVLGTNGRPFDEDSIGGRLAGRELSAHLRETGVMSGGPPALSQKDRSRFSSKLDELVQRGMREQERG